MFSILIVNINHLALFDAIDWLDPRPAHSTGVAENEICNSPRHMRVIYISSAITN